jgi:hypothetical protein
VGRIVNEFTIPDIHSRVCHLRQVFTKIEKVSRYEILSLDLEQAIPVRLQTSVAWKRNSTLANQHLNKTRAIESE